MLKYVNTGIVFQEIPDEVTLAINISNCPCHCPGCHSQYLWEDIGLPLNTEAIDDFVSKYGNDITCIAFMGGDADPVSVNMLAQYIHESYPKYKVAWYSGRIRIPAIIKKEDFDFIKIGPFIRHLGPLNKTTTNQRLYRKDDEGNFEDITERFWKK
ncbi:anaerobic ribonucleoside-triphosphate reductase activating protein [Prevotella sp. E13-17]|uniref:anaerobic ribonucleoside-triphosphate reductase activating protein n=1 Tax=Prevotella sp. E13-17 TaxID=2913616 RepID=UPI001EDC403D|nr:anaerobic ribonucleoside-triphosphate reductase activating protein [Prevotella sp. E13-17]UKK51926.1 anaerobic ribonucleoside-triphosphate reductase activating protein [Prevotella sp. E13-17]